MATDKNTIKSWFETGDTPTQEQFWALIESLFHKDETIPITSIADIAAILNEKADREVLENHLNDAIAHDNVIPAFATFKWILRGTNHTNNFPIAGDIFEGVISQEGEPLVVSSTLKWNGIGALNNTNLANFSISNSSSWEEPSLRSVAISTVNDTGYPRGICDAPKNQTAYFLSLEDFIQDGDALFEDEELTVVKPIGFYAFAGVNGAVGNNGIITIFGECT